jgi:serine/threonine protein kinase
MSEAPNTPEREEHDFDEDPRVTLAAALRKVELDGQRGLRVIIGNSERFLVDVRGQAYLIHTPSVSKQLTPLRIAARVERWPTLRKRKIYGHIILSSGAKLSAQTVAGDGSNLPDRVAAVGQWRDTNQLIASQVDSAMALLLEIAGVPRPEVRRVSRATTLRKRAADHAVSAPLLIPVIRRVPSPSPGMVVDAYQLQTRLGSGQSAQVWKAELTRQVPGVDLAIGSTVAMKLYSSAIFEGLQPLRVQREFAVASELDHPNLAKVYDLLLSPNRFWHAFIVMEYVEGATLKNTIRSRRTLNGALTLQVAEQLFGALHELHSRQAIHRDVKAANIMVSAISDESVSLKLVDLGIVAIATDHAVTMGSVFLGSKHSAPLEQLTGKPVDERVDIYGAGSVLYHCLTGRALYDGVGPEGAIVQRMLEDPETLPMPAAGKVQSGGGPFDRELVDLVNSCIQVDADRRPQTARECIDVIRAIRRRSEKPTRAE